VQFRSILRKFFCACHRNENRRIISVFSHSKNPIPFCSDVSFSSSKPSNLSEVGDTITGTEGYRIEGSFGQCQNFVQQPEGGIFRFDIILAVSQPGTDDPPCQPTLTAETRIKVCRYFPEHSGSYAPMPFRSCAPGRCTA